MSIHQRAGRWRASGTAGGPFSTRIGGYQRARRVWLCRACGAWHDAVPTPAGPVKPGFCSACGAGGRAWALMCDSRVEAQHFVALRLETRPGGRVRDLVHHPRFPLEVADPGGIRQAIGHYVADAMYLWRGDAGAWERRVDDVKPRADSAQDPLFVWKARHFRAQYGLEIRIIK